MASERKKALLKIGWSLALFLDVVFTVTVVSAGNLGGCAIAIVLGLLITYKGNPIIFAQYDAKRKARYEKRKQEYLKLKKDN